MTDLATIRTSLEQCFDAVESLSSRLNSDQWQAQSLCPDWDMRGVVTHLGMMERVMTGWLPASAEDCPAAGPDRAVPRGDRGPRRQSIRGPDRRYLRRPAR